MRLNKVKIQFFKLKKTSLTINLGLFQVDVYYCWINTGQKGNPQKMYYVSYLSPPSKKYHQPLQFFQNPLN